MQNIDGKNEVLASIDEEAEDQDYQKVNKQIELIE